MQKMHLDRYFLLVVLDQREDINAIQLAASVEKGELHGEGGAFHRSSEFLDELGGCRRSSAGGQQVVTNEDAPARLHGGFVDLPRIRAGFQRESNAGMFGTGVSLGC